MDAGEIFMSNLSGSDQIKRKPTGKQLLFIEYYLQTFNASLSAQMAGYNAGSDINFRKVGYQLLKSPHVKAALKERLEEIKKNTPAALELTEIRLKKGGSAISPKNGKGFIYFARADNGLIKIGRSYCVEFRLEELNKGLPYDLELLKTIESENCSKREKEFHAKFKDKRIRGEWFALDQSDLEQLQGE